MSPRHLLPLLAACAAGALSAAERATALTVVPPPEPVAASGTGALGDDGLRLGTAAFTGGPWDDGLAEVADYDLRQFRYGELHPGSATLIVVREDLDPHRGVKAGRDATATVPVLKCHLVTSYQTGVYRYDQAVTTFLRRSDAVPLRLFVTSHEWCGSAGKSWLNRGPGSEVAVMSYFDGHGDLRQPLALGAEDLLADALPVALRAWLALPDAPTAAQLIPSQVEARTVATAPVPVRLERSATAQAVTVTVSGQGIREEFTYAAAAPQVLQAWNSADGTTRRLTRVRRFDYWAHHGTADRPR